MENPKDNPVDTMDQAIGALLRAVEEGGDDAGPALAILENFSIRSKCVNHFPDTWGCARHAESTCFPGRRKVEKVLFLIQYGYVQPGVATRTRWGIVNAEDLNEALIYAEQAAAALIDKRGQTGRPGVAPVHGAYPLDDLLQPGHHIDVDFYYE